MNEPEAELIRLTLAFPPALEPRIVELLLEHEPAVPGFTVLQGEGHGVDFSRASIREQVRGRVARRVLLMVMPESEAQALLAKLRSAVPNPQVTWWMERVLGFGRLA